MSNIGKLKVTKYIQNVEVVLDDKGRPIQTINFKDSFVISVHGNDQYLEYDYDTNEWYFNIGSSLNEAIALNDLSDVELTNLQGKDIFMFDSTLGKWVNDTSTITEINQKITDLTTYVNTQITTVNQTITNNQTTAQTNLSEAIPDGVIVMWSGRTVPTNWVLCDGSNGTPNLTDRFIVGANMQVPDPGSPFVSGGVSSPTQTTTEIGTATIGTNNLPKHTHSLSLGGAGTVTTSAAGSHSHTIYAHNNISSGNRIAQADSADGYQSVAADSVGAVGDHTHTVDLSGISGSIGDGGFANDPLSVNVSVKARKYYSLAFIMKKTGAASVTYPRLLEFNSDNLNNNDFDNNNSNQGDNFNANSALPSTNA